MTTPGPRHSASDDDRWDAALGEAVDPANPHFEPGVVYQPGTAPARWPRVARQVLLVVVILAVLAGGAYALIGKKSKTPADAGSDIVTAPLTASSAPHSAVTVANTATEHAAQLAGALTANTNWGQLAPFLKDIAKAGVPTTCLNVSSSNVAQCRFGAKPASHHAALIGDAAALDYMPALVAALQPKGWDLQVLTEANCPAAKVAITINGVPDTACTDHHKFVLDELASLKPTLIVTSDQDIDLAYATAPPKPKGEPRQTSHDAFVSGLTSSVEKFAEYGKVLVINSPPGTKPITDCQAGSPPPKACASTVRPAWQAYGRLVRDTVEKHATYIDPLPYFCADGKCPAIVGVTPTYINGARLSLAFSKSLSFVFAPYVK